VEENGNK